MSIIIVFITLAMTLPLCFPPTDYSLTTSTLTSFSLNKFIGTIGFTQSHSSLNVGVGSLCGFFRVLFPFLEPFELGKPLGDGTILACGSAHANGEADTATAAARRASKRRIVSVNRFSRGAAGAHKVLCRFCWTDAGQCRTSQGRN